MAASVAYLEQALATGAEELEALRDGDVEKATELAEKRSWLVSQAWSVRLPVDNALYRDNLLALQRMQEELSKQARSCQDAIRTSLLKSRKEGQRLAAYKVAAAHAF